MTNKDIPERHSYTFFVIHHKQRLTKCIPIYYHCITSLTKNIDIQRDILKNVSIITDKPKHSQKHSQRHTQRHSYKIIHHSTNTKYSMRSSYKVFVTDHKKSSINIHPHTFHFSHHNQWFYTEMLTILQSLTTNTTTYKEIVTQSFHHSRQTKIT